METEQPHSYIIQMGSEIMGKRAGDLYKNDNSHGSFHLNRGVLYTILSYTAFHLKQWSWSLLTLSCSYSPSCQFHSRLLCWPSNWSPCFCPCSSWIFDQHCSQKDPLQKEVISYRSAFLTASVVSYKGLSHFKVFVLSLPSEWPILPPDIHIIHALTFSHVCSVAI